MLIHTDQVYYLGGMAYEYRVEMNGNLFLLRFQVNRGEQPETGDKVVDNKLVKAKDDKD